MSAEAQQNKWADHILCFFLWAGIFCYLAALPRDLGTADESYFLLEAKRILGGEVVYRDIFWFAMPAAHWVMALTFGIFGTNIETARLAMAVLHGMIAVVLFLACRRLGVSRALALIPPVAHVAIGHPAFPYAAPHWFATFFMVAILFVAIGRNRAHARSWPIIPGVLTGALASCYQQQGAAFALGLCALFVLDDLLGRRDGSRRPNDGAVHRLGYFVPGILIVVVPVLVVMLATAGPASLFEQLVVHPLTGYHSFNRTSWGRVGLLSVSFAQYTQPVLLKYLPVVVVLGVFRAAHKWRARTDRAGLGDLAALITLCTTAALAIAYFPDFIHIAFIAPIFFVFCAETLEAAFRRVEVSGGHPRMWRALAAICLLCGLMAQLRLNMIRAHREYPFSHDTDFGRIDFDTTEQIRLVERTRALMRDVPSRELFVYPAYTSLYLTAGANNPTPYQFFFPGFNLPEHTHALLELLQSRKLPYIVVMPSLIKGDDPILHYIRQDYECVDPSETDRRIFFRRRTEAPPPKSP